MRDGSPIAYVALLFALSTLVSCSSTSTEASPKSADDGDDTIVETKVALIVYFPRLGQLNANIRELTGLISEALDNGARLVVAPELAITGYSITGEQVRDGLGLRWPFFELAEIRALADRYRAYIYLGIAEVDPREDGEHIFNTVVNFGPDDIMGYHRRRNMLTWNERGRAPFPVLSTPFGDIGAVICADAYMMDWVRLMALDGADVIVSPANWWGMHEQVSTWRARARENGVWMLVANRWGAEFNKHGLFWGMYNMNSSPSVVVAPDGEPQVLYRARDESEPANKILYATIRVPAARIGDGANDTYTVAGRRPSAYREIANSYYYFAEGNREPPDLPPPGAEEVTTIAYRPQADPGFNLNVMTSLLDFYGAAPDILVLPGLGISQRPIAVDTSDWPSEMPWRRFFQFVEARDIELAVTTVLVHSTDDMRPRLAVLAARAGKPPLVIPQVHDAWGMPGSGQPPGYIDLTHLRVAVLTGADSLFPEISTHLSKQGVDLVLVSSIVGAAEMKTRGVPEPAAEPTDWTIPDLFVAWLARTNETLHLAGVDASGNGVMIEDVGIRVERSTVDADAPVWTGSVSNRTVRHKFLNSYNPDDLQRLLRPN